MSNTTKPAVPEKKTPLIKNVSPLLCKLSVSNDESPDGCVEGYGSVFNVTDSYGDIVLPGAFKKTLKERLKPGLVKMLDNHRSSSTESCIGVIVEAKEDEYGLWFKAKFSSTALAQSVRTKIKEGILNGLSIAYNVVKADPNKATEYGLLLKEVKLYEISVVIWGANSDALVEYVKNELTTEEDAADVDTEELKEVPLLAEDSPTAEDLAKLAESVRISDLSTKAIADAHFLLAMKNAKYALCTAIVIPKDF